MLRLKSAVVVLHFLPLHFSILLSVWLIVQSISALCDAPAFLLKPLAYFSLPVFLLHTASSISPLCRYYIRLCLYLSSLGVCSVWGVLVSIGLTLVGRRFDINWVTARSFYAVASSALGIRFEVEGEEYLSNTGASVLMGNHQSMLDILYLGRIFPKRASIMGKKELKWTPFLGQFMTLSGAVFVDRGNNAKAIKSLHDAGQSMKARGTSLWVFPEGTRSNTEKPDLLPFKKGGFHLAVQAGLPITPVVCESYWRLYHKGTLESGILKIKVLPPVPTAGLTASDVPELISTVREQMLEALRGISGPFDSNSKEEEVNIDKPVQKSFNSKQSVPELEDREDDYTTTGKPVAPSIAVGTNQVDKMEGESDKGADTEEDEGMVLVGRPS